QLRSWTLSIISYPIVQAPKI
ncbi:unnamed protein product, partial [Adineta steineri]